MAAGWSFTARSRAWIEDVPPPLGLPTHAGGATALEGSSQKNADGTTSTAPAPAAAGAPPAG